VTEPLAAVREFRAGAWTVLAEAPLCQGLERADLAGALRGGPPAGPAPRGRGVLQRLEIAGGPALVLRRYRHGGMLAGLTGDRFLGHGRFLREFELGRAAWADGVPTPRPVAVGWKAGAIATRGFLATVELDGARDLLDLFAAPISAPKRHAAVRSSARAIRALHDAGVDHADLHLKNLLVGEGPAGPGSTAWVVDLDLARRVAGGLPRAARVSNLARLYRSVEKHRRRGLHIDAEDVDVFCDAYFGDDAEGRAAARGALGLARLRARIRP
jgi:tRNA A-37 threonylcarbamoyl transferase component Bud32